MSVAGDRRADRIAARATGLGIGLIVFMMTWTIGARIIERMVDEPTSAYAAMCLALVTGAVTTVRASHRLIAGAPSLPDTETAEQSLSRT